MQYKAKQNKQSKDQKSRPNSVIFTQLSVIYRQHVLNKTHFTSHLYERVNWKDFAMTNEFRLHIKYTYNSEG